MYSNTLTLGIVLVILVSFFVAVVDMTYPIISKSRFDETCRQYATLVAAEGDLSEDALLDLKGELESIGFEDIDIQIQYLEPLKFNDDITFQVKAGLKNKITRYIFFREDVVLPCTYKMVLTYRKYQN